MWHLKKVSLHHRWFQLARRPDVTPQLLYFDRPIKKRNSLTKLNDANPKLVCKCLSVAIWDSRGEMIALLIRGGDVDWSRCFNGPVPCENLKDSMQQRFSVWSLHLICFFFKWPCSADFYAQPFILSHDGCSSKLRSAQCDGCVSLTFMSPHQPRQPPMNLLWCDPCEKTFHEDLSSNTFFLHTSSRLAWATQRRLGSWCPSLEKPMCNGTVRWLDRMLFLRLCIYSAH